MAPGSRGFRAHDTSASEGEACRRKGTGIEAWAGGFAWVHSVSKLFQNAALLPVCYLNLHSELTETADFSHLSPPNPVVDYHS
jgi:hypothetical protein